MATPTAAPERDLTRITLTILGAVCLIGASLRILLPFLGAIFWATTIAVSTWNLMISLQKRAGGRRWVGVTGMTVALLLILFLPLAMAVSALLDQSDRIVDLARKITESKLPAPPAWLDRIPLLGHELSGRWAALSALEPRELATKLAPYLRRAAAWFAAQAGGFASMLLQFLLTVAISAILFAKGEAAAAGLRRFFRRINPAQGDATVVLAGKAIRAVALGIVVTALVQTCLAGVGLFATGIPFPGFLTAVCLLLCIAQIGPMLILIPGIIWLYSNESPLAGTVLVAITALTGVIDNVLRPILIKRGADLSLLIILPGVIGGLLWLGIIGLFVGPIVLAVSYTLLQSWVATGLAEAPAAPPAPPEPAAADVPAPAA